MRFLDAFFEPLLLLVAMLGLATMSCGPSYQQTHIGSDRTIPVLRATAEVENRNFYDAVIYVGGYRIGRVGGVSEEVLTFSSRGTRSEVVIKMIASETSFGIFDIQPGDTLVIVVTPRVESSHVYVVRGR